MMEFPAVARVTCGGFWSDSYRYFFCEGQTIVLLGMTHDHDTWYTTFYVLMDDGTVGTVTWSEGTPEMHQDYMLSRIGLLNLEDFGFTSV